MADVISVVSPTTSKMPPPRKKHSVNGRRFISEIYCQLRSNIWNLKMKLNPSLCRRFCRTCFASSVEVTVLKATAEAVMPILCSTEHQLLKDPAKAKLYEAEIKKLIGGGALPSLVQKRWSQ